MLCFCWQGLAQEVACYLGLQLGGIRTKRSDPDDILLKLYFCWQGLAQEVACYLGLQLGGIRIKRFADGEIYVQVQESIRGCDVFLVQPTAPPVNDHLMELLVMIDACRRASARSITAVVSLLNSSDQRA